MKTNQVKYLAINLPSSKIRRDNLKKQESLAGIHIDLVEAVAGATLTESQKECYLAQKRNRLTPIPLKPNEQAYIHSYRKALQVFLDSPAEYGIIMDDDVVLSEKFTIGIKYLLEKVGGWEACKLYQAPCKLYDVFPEIPNAPVKPVFPRKITNGSVCYMYSRKAASIILKETREFYMEADPLIAKILMDNNLPIIATTPNLANTLYPNNEQSEIDADDPRYKSSKPKRNLIQYIFHRLRTLNFTLAKMKMLKLVRKSLYRNNL